jgi:hypothetical protein
LKNYLFYQLQANSTAGRYIVHRGEPLQTDYIIFPSDCLLVASIAMDAILPFLLVERILLSQAIDTNITTLIVVTIAAHH